MAVRILTRVPITSASTAQHAPLVAGAIGGVETLLVLDTGSDVHLLTKELVDRLGLAVEAGEEGVDHSGATMPSWSVEDAALTLGDVELMLGDLVSIPAPAPFTRWGIGGILSPQHLHPTAVSVIDLHHDELLLVDADDEELVSWLEARSPGLSPVMLERDLSFPSLVVSGIAVRPFPEMPTLLNSGGKRTEFARDAVPGLGGSESERLGGGVSGADVIGRAAGAQVLDVAGHDLPVTELAVRETMHDAQGMVGIDVLRGTVLAFALARGAAVSAGPAGRGDAAGAARTLRVVRASASGRRGRADTRPSPRRGRWRARRRGRPSRAPARRSRRSGRRQRSRRPDTRPHPEPAAARCPCDE